MDERPDHDPTLPGHKENLMSYIDAFVLPVAKKNLPAYTKVSKAASKVWMEHGAVDYRECVVEDPKPGFGVPFPALVKAKKSEVVVFSWIMYKSRAHRDRVNAKVMKDPRLAAMCNGPTPFDLRRMATGGFKVFVKP